MKEARALLTQREIEVGFLSIKGFSASSIAQYLQVSCDTVQKHRARLKKKLQTQSAFQTGARLFEILEKVS